MSAIENNQHALEQELLNLLDTYEENSIGAQQEYKELGYDVTNGMAHGFQICADQLKRVLELYGIKE